MRANRLPTKLSNKAMTYKYLKVAIFLGILAFAVDAKAAIIFFEPAQTTKAVGETFTVNVRLNTEGEAINAVELGFLYPGVLRVRSVSKAGSAIQLWVQEPSFTGAAITFIGGAPGGIRSSSALIGRITFEARALGEGGLGLTSDSSVLLNDGSGTAANLKIASTLFKIDPRGSQPETTASPDAETPAPEAEEFTDSKKPNRFVIIVGTDPRVFNGQKFISFFTTDAESGIDRYEVREGKGPYKVARTPYLLSEPDKRNTIRVRAYDFAGNYRESVYPGILRRMLWWVLNLF